MLKTNDQILLDAIIEEQREVWGKTIKEDKLFELFSADQILKNQNLDASGIQSGNIGQGLDGQIDSFYIFADGEVVEDVDSVVNVRKNFALDVWVIQSKTSPSFDATTIEKLQATVLNIFDFSRLESLTTEEYSSDLLQRAKLFKEVYEATAVKFPTLQIHYRYVTRGQTENIHQNVKTRRDFLVQRTKELFEAARAMISFEFVGAKELVEMNRAERTYTLTLRLQETPIVATEGYLALVNLKDYYQFITNENGELRSYIFDLNVRDYQGAVEVNQDIEKSLASDQDINFWVLNNGVTIIADRGSSVAKDLTLENVQIVNGLQTSQSIYNYLSQHIHDDEKRSVLAKIIIKDDPAVIDKIIKASNFQTAIPLASLKATDKFQRTIEEFLKRHEIYYDRRKGYYKNTGKPASRIISIPALAQAVVSIVRQDPQLARAKPASLVKKKEDYARVFSEDVPLPVYKYCAESLLITQGALRRDLGKPINEIKLNFKYQILYATVAKKIGKLRFGPPELCDQTDSTISDEEVIYIAESMVSWVESYRKENSVTLDGVAKSEKFTEYLRKKMSIAV